MRLDVGGPAVHQPVPYGLKTLADFMALQPIKESFPSDIMIRQVQFLGEQLMACLINGMKEALSHPDSGQFSF